MLLETFEEYKQYNVNKLNDIEEKIKQVIEVGANNRERDNRLDGIDVQIAKLVDEMV